MTAIEDRGLPALAQALDTDRMLQPLMEAARFPDGTQLACAAEILKHKPGRRCTIRYILEPVSPDGTVRPVALVGKLNGESRMTARVYGWTWALRSAGFAGSGMLRVPAPVAFLPSLGLMVHENIEGADLRHALSGGDTEVAFRLAGQWLAVLHSVPAPPDVEEKGPAHELRKMSRWRDEVAPYLGRGERTKLRFAQNALRSRARNDPTHWIPALIHRDFYPANVVWDGHSIWVVDFDELALGDPALDVAHFLAHVQNVSLKDTGACDAHARASAHFLNSYQETSKASLAARLPFYKSYTFLKLAAKEARRKRGDWESLFTSLIDLACREAEGFARPEEV
jgi:tRNA A-37 threonylcarbamoyl transferase component Bud32